MRLVNYGPGEISDRLTILALKILFGTEAGKDTKHFTDERNALLKQIAARNVSGRWMEEIVTLGAINAALWHAEDDLRGLRKSKDAGGSNPPQDFMEVAIRIQQLNDARAACIERINQQTGDHTGSEKL